MKPFLPAALLAVALGACSQQAQTPEADAAAAAVAGTPTPLVVATPLASTTPATATMAASGPAEPAMPASVVPTPQSSPVTGPINGYYQGRVEQVEAKIPACPLPAHGVIEIGDRTLLFPYTYQIIYVAPILADGTIHAEALGTTLDGTLIDGHLTFIVTTPECRSTFDFTRRRGL